MKYLFLDASGTNTFGLVSDGKNLFTMKQNTSRTLGAQITTFCDELLNKAGLSKHEIDLYAACTGPGSLTGLRIAGSFLRSCAYISNKPLIGIDLFSWAIQTLKDQNTTEKVRLIMPTLIGKAFYLDTKAHTVSMGNQEIKPEFSDLITVSDCEHKLLGIKYSTSTIEETKLSDTAIDSIIKTYDNGQQNCFSEMLQVLPMYVIPSQAERNFRGKKC